jgi:acyl-CoA synthetase (AMP-forming)/AMP-acid ligase II
MNAKEHWSVADMFEDAVRQNPDKEALLYLDTNTSYSFRRVDEITNQSMCMGLYSNVMGDRYCAWCMLD